MLRVCLVCWLCIAVGACTPAFKDSTIPNVPVAVAERDTESVDLDVVFEDVQGKVQKVLPSAYYQGIVFSGRSRDLPDLQGKLVIVFVQVTPRFLGRKVIRATAVVDTVLRRADLHYEDVTRLYPSTAGYVYPGDTAIRKVFSTAYEHIVQLGLSDSEVTITQLADAWDVRCGPLGSFEARCRFQVVGGKVIDGTR